jgi:F420H(2)-dependent quinone reductase
MLRHVDPHAPHGRLYHAVCRFSMTKLGWWMSEHIAWKLDPHVMRFTRGRVRSSGPLASALLETCGARTGRRRNATLYFHDGDRVTIIASKRGEPTHPAWLPGQAGPAALSRSCSSCPDRYEGSPAAIR